MGSPPGTRVTGEGELVLGLDVSTENVPMLSSPDEALDSQHSIPLALTHLIAGMFVSRHEITSEIFQVSVYFPIESCCCADFSGGMILLIIANSPAQT